MPSSPPGAFAADAVSPTRPTSSAPPRSSTPAIASPILVGQGARGAAAEVEQVADVLGAGVAKALLGKDVLPDDLPFVTGSIGLLGTRPSYELMRDCDTLLIVGSNFPYSQFLPEYGKARAVQIDVDGALIGMRYPTELNIVADAGATLRALLPLLAPRSDRKWRETVEQNVADWWTTVERQSMVDADPVNPMRIVWEMSQVLPDDAIITADSGSVANWYAKVLRMRRGMRGSLSGTLATMGAGVPYAIGAKFAHPDRPVVALMGDGAMQMNGMAELLTIGRYRDRWADQRLIVCVLHNNDLNQVTWELRAMGGAPKFEESQVLPDVSYADFATADRPARASPCAIPTSSVPRGSRRSPPTGPDRHRRVLRPGGAADPAARDPRPGRVDGRVGAGRRPVGGAPDGAGREGEAAGAPARPERLSVGVPGYPGRHGDDRTALHHHRRRCPRRERRAFAHRRARRADPAAGQLPHRADGPVQPGADPRAAAARQGQRRLRVTSR